MQVLAVPLNTFIKTREDPCWAIIKLYAVLGHVVLEEFP